MHYIKPLLLLFIYALALNLPYIHLREFQGEEGRRVIVTVNMIESGDWVVPYVEGTVYLRKPPLFNWFLAGIFKFTGRVSETTARIPSVISSFLSALGLSLFYQRITKMKSLWFILPGLIFLTFAEVMGKAIKAEIDITFTLFVTLSLILWFYFYEVQNSSVLAWAAGLSFVGLGLLTKGIQAPIFFYSSVIPYLIYQRKIKRISSLSHLIGISIFFIIISLWFIPLINRVGVNAIANTWLGEILVRKESVGGGSFFKHFIEFPFLYIASYLPWIPFMLLWIYRPLKEVPDIMKKVATFCLFSLILSVPFYWFIPGAWLRYLLPVSGMLSILITIPLSSIMMHKLQEPVLCKTYLKTLSISLIIAALSAPFWGKRLGLYAGSMPFIFLSGVFVLALLLLFEKRPARKISFLLLTLLFARLSWASLYFPYHDEYLSHYRNAAQQINSLVSPDVSLYDYGVDNPHLAYYLKRPVQLIDSMAEGNIRNGSIILIKKDVSNKLNIEGMPHLSFIGEVKARNVFLELYEINRDKLDNELPQ